MGINRKQCENKYLPKVFKRLSDNYSDKEKLELFCTWNAYNELKKKFNNIECLDYLSDKDLKYFTIVGLEIFNKEYIKEIENEKY